jgi:hypothetical protein
MVAAQVAAFEAQQECCPDCGRARRRNGRHEIVYRTLFGKRRRDSPGSTRARVGRRGPAPASARWPNSSRSGRPRSWPTWKASSRR